MNDLACFHSAILSIFWAIFLLIFKKKTEGLVKK
jgi:hypothetical protein